MSLAISKTDPDIATLADCVGGQLRAVRFTDNYLTILSPVATGLLKTDAIELRDLLTVFIETGKLPKEMEPA